MVYLKTDEEVELMRQSNILLSKLYGELAKLIKPGISTAELDRIAEEYIRDNGGIPACKGYEDFLHERSFRVEGFRWRIIS